MADRARSTMEIKSCLRSQSCRDNNRDKVTRKILD